MKNKLLLLFTFFFVFNCSLLLAQESNEYDIEGKLSITIPTTYEIQKESQYSRKSNIEYINTFVKNNGEIFVESTTSEKHFVFQQKGLNKHDKSAFEQYSRIVIDYYKDSELPEYGQKIDVDDSYFKSAINQLDSGLTTQGMSVEKVIDYGVVSINGFPATKIEYIRSGFNSAPSVHCSLYEIFNKEEEIVINLSYRIKEGDKWKDVENSVVNSLRFKDKHIFSTKEIYDNQKIPLTNSEENEFRKTSYSYLVLIVGLLLYIVVRHKNSKRKL